MPRASTFFEDPEAMNKDTRSSVATVFEQTEREEYSTNRREQELKAFIDTMRAPNQAGQVWSYFGPGTLGQEDLASVYWKTDDRAISGVSSLLSEVWTLTVMDQLARAVTKYFSLGWMFLADPKAIGFLVRRSLLAQFDTFVKVATTIFQNANMQSIEYQSDPNEPGEEWVTLQLRVCEEANNRVHDRYRAFVFAALEHIPARTAGLLRLSLDIVRSE